MSGWVTACQLEDIEQEGVLRFDQGSRTFAVYRGPDDSVYCTSGAFDYRTGEAVRLPPCVNLKTYPAEVIDGEVRIAIG